MTIERGLVRTGMGHVHYRAAGRGRPVMLFHINQQSSALMLELMEALAPHMRAVAIDYPGHGDSDHVSVQPHIEDYADCGVAVMDALGIGTACVLGEAVGAAVSAALAANHPGRVERAVLVNCPLFVDRANADGDIDEIRNRLRPADETGFPRTRTIDYMMSTDPVHAPVRPSQSWMDRVNTAQMEAGRDRWQALEALARFDMEGTLARVACPALLLTGERFYYGRHRARIEAALRDVRSETVGGGNFCMTWEFAGEIARRATAFFGTA